jgi:hypothetical protein
MIPGGSVLIHRKARYRNQPGHFFALVSPIPIAAIGRQLAIADADMAEWLTRSADCFLGHIAAGTDRHGRPFVTVYYGADDGHLPN